MASRGRHCVSSGVSERQKKTQGDRRRGQEETAHPGLRVAPFPLWLSLLASLNRPVGPEGLLFLAPPKRTATDAKNKRPWKRRSCGVPPEREREGAEKQNSSQLELSQWLLQQQARIHPNGENENKGPEEAEERRLGQGDREHSTRKRDRNRA